MKAEGAAIDARVIRPDFFSSRFVQGKKFSRAGPDKQQSATDRGLREDSTTGLNLPDNGSFILCGQGYRSQQQADGNTREHATENVACLR